MDLKRLKPWLADCSGDDARRAAQLLLGIVSAQGMPIRPGYGPHPVRLAHEALEKFYAEKGI